MKITLSSKSLSQVKQTAVSVYFKSGKLTKVFENKDTGKEIHLAIPPKKDIDRRKFILLIRKIVQISKVNSVSIVAIDFKDLIFPKIQKIDRTEIASLVAQNLEMANFSFNKFKTKPKEGWGDMTEIIICGISSKAERLGFIKGQTIGKAVNDCRTLSNTPGGDMTPSILAKVAQKALKGLKTKVTILGQKELEKQKMGAILGVSKGSEEEPKFIILEYWGYGTRKTPKRMDKNNPIVLIGKGVTFDTGGLNLKPEGGIFGMHMDMSGGAAVIQAVALAAKLKLKKNVIGLIPAVENMPSGTSYRPGDILQSMSGKTIEVLNTDAEGRVILADALTYAKRYNPRLVVDVATLTGAAAIALGQHASAILTRDQKLENLFRQLGEESGDYVWPLPMWDEYEEYIKGIFGDVANIASSGNSRYGGAINGAMFLYQFAKDYPWVHIDMAPRMETAPSDNLVRGAAGEPVRLLTKLIETF